MQTCLEKNAIEKRNESIVRSDYNAENPYGANHKDAISDGDVKGKGTNNGGHTHTLPDCQKGPNMMNYSNFDTEKGGGLYDVEGRNGIGGRNRAVASSMYNKENQYGAHLVNTEANLNLGQYKS